VGSPGETGGEESVGTWWPTFGVIVVSEEGVLKEVLSDQAAVEPPATATATVVTATAPTATAPTATAGMQMSLAQK